MSVGKYNVVQRQIKRKICYLKKYQNKLYKKWHEIDMKIEILNKEFEREKKWKTTIN